MTAASVGLVIRNLIDVGSAPLGTISLRSDVQAEIIYFRVREICKLGRNREPLHETGVREPEVIDHPVGERPGIGYDRLAAVGRDGAGKLRERSVGVYIRTARAVI